MTMIKFLYRVIKFFSGWVELVGFLFIVLLTTYSIAFLKIGYIGYVTFDFNKLVSDNTMAWLWIIILCSYVIKTIVDIVKRLKNGIKSIKEKKTQISINSIVQWLIKN